jgi:iron only hydrogenase large subunit-like protein
MAVGKNTLVVLNPVIKMIIGEHNYEKTIEMIINKSWLAADVSPGKEAVKKDYKALFYKPGRPIIDSRCPAIIELVKQNFPHLDKSLAPINPILVTGARIRKKELEDSGYDIVKVIAATPCSDFCRNNHRWPDLEMITWKDFQKKVLGVSFPRNELKESPVPLGFFNDLGVKVYSASGEENCRCLLSDIPPDAKLLELLWCKGGCHKGDGLY